VTKQCPPTSSTLASLAPREHPRTQANAGRDTRPVCPSTRRRIYLIHNTLHTHRKPRRASYFGNPAVTMSALCAISALWGILRMSKGWSSLELPLPARLTAATFPWHTTHSIIDMASPFRGRFPQTHHHATHYISAHGVSHKNAALPQQQTSRG
jgi:hypothetical protein